MVKQGKTLSISSSPSSHSLWELRPSSCLRRTKWLAPSGTCTVASKNSATHTFSPGSARTESSILVSCTVRPGLYICSLIKGYQQP
ncbi:hypothetical protein LINPERPRIM_LOCUS18571 [Linum perenne]